MWGAIEMRRFCVTMFAAFACVSAAWGQTPIATLVTDGGCKALRRLNNAVPSFTWSGTCEGGLVSGIGIFSYQINSNGALIRIHSKALNVTGMETGAVWTVTDANIRRPDTVDSLRLSIMEDGVRGAGVILSPTAESAASAVWGAQHVLDIAGEKKLRSMDANTLLADVRRWHENPIAFIRNISVPGTAQSSNPDDPKVRGRSARGG